MNSTPILAAAFGSRITVRTRHANGTSRDESGLLLDADLTAHVPWVAIEAGSHQHVRVMLLGPGAELLVPYEPPVAHPGLGPDPAVPAHPGLAAGPARPASWPVVDR